MTISLLDEKPIARARMSSLTCPQLDSFNVPGNQARPSPLASQNGTSVTNMMPADKLKEQDDSSLAEMAVSLATEVDKYLDSTDIRSLTIRRMASIRDDEQIGTPVKVKSPKKCKTKSQGSAEKQPLSSARQVLFTIIICNYNCSTLGACIQVPHPIDLGFPIQN